MVMTLKKKENPTIEVKKNIKEKIRTTMPEKVKEIFNNDWREKYPSREVPVLQPILGEQIEFNLKLEGLDTETKERAKEILRKSVKKGFNKLPSIAK